MVEFTDKNTGATIYELGENETTKKLVKIDLGDNFYFPKAPRWLANKNDTNNNLGSLRAMVIDITYPDAPAVQEIYLRQLGRLDAEKKLVFTDAINTAAASKRENLSVNKIVAGKVFVAKEVKPTKVKRWENGKETDELTEKMAYSWEFNKTAKFDEKKAQELITAYVSTICEKVEKIEE